MIIEIVAATAIFAAGYKWGSTVRSAALKDLQQAEASAEAELADLKAKIASAAQAVVPGFESYRAVDYRAASTKSVVPAVVAEVKAAL